MGASDAKRKQVAESKGGKEHAYHVRGAREGSWWAAVPNEASCKKAQARVPF